MKVAEILEGALREDSPISFSRLITFVIVAFVLGWDTSYVTYALLNAKLMAKTSADLVAAVSNALPPVGTLAAQGVFMTLFYATNKAAGAYSNSGKSDPAKPAGQ